MSKVDKMNNGVTEDESPETRKWVEWLERLTTSVNQDKSDSAMQLCENAMESWQTDLSSENKPLPGGPGALIVVEAMQALVQAAANVGFDYVNTPDERDRLTHDAVQQELRAELSQILEESRAWMTEGAPTAEEISARIESAKHNVERIQDDGKEQLDKDAADDAAAAADPYGAVLGYVDPNVDAAIIFTKVCSFTKDEDSRYRHAHERLRRMIDSELLQHMSDERDRFCDVLIETLTDITERRVSLSDQDAFDERRRRVRSALIAFTSAVHSHKDQSIRAVREQFGRKTPEEQQVLSLFNSLLDSSFDYRWLVKMRDALLHGDINAFKINLNARLEGDSEANVLMDRNYMLQFTREAREKWLKRDELEAKTSDPSVLDMIKAVQDPICELQDKLDAILYPNVAEDTATVRELIQHFKGRRGLYALQSGPGFTRRLRVPPYSFLAPRVLAFADTYTDGSGHES
ncbi:site-specific recombinase [Gordonia desulfuricans]|uniref:Site-specific recombinase n=1 Tax=Gordonia desulfuricans TaxID=89051 RepID=A0A7K3LTF9_9ACTN|nr:hypothetical protein [Gordonia desulfuricans]NDK91291.1 site-specific recombinase [Gordonia desulfuricans]